MKELERRQLARRVIYSIPSLCLLVLLTFLLARGALGIFLKERESAKRVSELETKALAREKRQEELEAFIARLKTEEGIVDEIKDKFSVVREGEHVAIIVDAREDQASTSVTKISWYKRLWTAIMSLYE
ncbi:MAG: hypothetical protein AAB641_01245 [Patescibacteria group bacterium]